MKRLIQSIGLFFVWILIFITLFLPIIIMGLLVVRAPVIFLRGWAIIFFCLLVIVTIIPFEKANRIFNKKNVINAVRATKDATQYLYKSIFALNQRNKIPLGKIINIYSYLFSSGSRY